MGKVWVEYDVLREAYLCLVRCGGTDYLLKVLKQMMHTHACLCPFWGGRIMAHQKLWFENRIGTFMVDSENAPATQRIRNEFHNLLACPGSAPSRCCFWGFPWWICVECHIKQQQKKKNWMCPLVVDYVLNFVCFYYDRLYNLYETNNKTNPL